MKFGRTLAIIVHYMVQFNLVCCKCSVSNMDPNTILKNKNIIIRRLKSENYKIQCTILMKFGGPLAITVHYTVQFNLECCISSVSNLGPNTSLKIKKIIIRRIKSEIKKISNIQSL